MNNNSVVFREESKGYFLCENVKDIADESLSSLKSIVMEFNGHRVTLSFLYGFKSGIQGRTYYSDKVESVKAFLSEISAYVAKQSRSDILIDEHLCNLLNEHNIEVRYVH